MEGDVTRRNFLNSVINTLIGIWALSMGALSGYTGLRYLWPTEKTAGGPGEKKTSFSMAELPEGGMKKVVIGGKPAGVIRIKGQVYALSLICTHLGCIVNWHPEEQRLICPCHNGTYDVTGAVLGGPPPRPLPSYEVRVSGDTVVIG